MLDAPCQETKAYEDGFVASCLAIDSDFDSHSMTRQQRQCQEGDGGEYRADHDVQVALGKGDVRTANDGCPDLLQVRNQVPGEGSSHSEVTMLEATSRELSPSISSVICDGHGKFRIALSCASPGDTSSCESPGELSWASKGFPMLHSLDDASCTAKPRETGARSPDCHMTCTSPRRLNMYPERFFNHLFVIDGGGIRKRSHVWEGDDGYRDELIERSLRKRNKPTCLDCPEIRQCTAEPTSFEDTDLYGIPLTYWDTADLKCTTNLHSTVDAKSTAAPKSTPDLQIPPQVACPSTSPQISADPTEISLPQELMGSGGPVPAETCCVPKRETAETGASNGVDLDKREGANQVLRPKTQMDRVNYAEPAASELPVPDLRDPNLWWKYPGIKRPDFVEAAIKEIFANVRREVLQELGSWKGAWKLRKFTLKLDAPSAAREASRLGLSDPLCPEGSAAPSTNIDSDCHYVHTKSETSRGSRKSE